jgi:3-phenylpropionate/trans-cinnamate dioxygenase ferredoxin subunit
MPTTVCHVDELPPGSRRIVQVGHLSIGIFNVDGELFALKNTCPHRGAPLCTGRWGGTMLASGPNEYRYGKQDRILRCPWHQWEYDLESGCSLVDPDRFRVKTYPVAVIEEKVIIEPEGRQ